MTVRVLAVGKKHEAWVTEGIDRYEKRLRKPFDVSWQLLPHSAREGDAARAEESERILAKVDRDAFLVLLDERGRNVDSPELAATLQGAFAAGRSVTVVIGGAYGVADRVRERADFVWSLSKLVFPHQLVRLILAEQIYRAQEIAAGRPYHHV
ncbi:MULTISPECIES: 23S rRNA (pseudouridine(1915)-N(3))-methyltransferase RlmH [unclassified Leucobacter]|uniref:23S rRNA (pseudouridine(1915)-N(3))-methyltransferase RlmH n=1 Tax=unclassified Leucobacter TaxID=2621730 RepID=UPI00301762E0